MYHWSTPQRRLLPEFGRVIGAAALVRGLRSLWKIGPEPKDLKYWQVAWDRVGYAFFLLPFLKGTSQ